MPPRLSPTTPSTIRAILAILIRLVSSRKNAMPITAIFKQLKKMNYQGVVHLEYEINADNPVPGMLRSFAYMRGVLAGLKG